VPVLPLLMRDEDDDARGLVFTIDDERAMLAEQKRRWLYSNLALLLLLLLLLFVFLLLIMQRLSLQLARKVCEIGIVVWRGVGPVDSCRSEIPR
jgi:hypothetical protein